MTEPYTYTARRDGDGSLWTEVDGRPGCFASGRDEDELAANVAETVALYDADGGAKAGAPQDAAEQTGLGPFATDASDE